MPCPVKGDNAARASLRKVPAVRYAEILKKRALMVILINDISSF